ncbi:amidohydrolase family protein [Cucumibacter marinus]|uniref:amidohydrolase family protein n=1 Tax=Cucumibacter marinus TaxID=1121252 RepID=UPI0003FD9F06|nr:amidohydrolase family protein [Cucumibacter marinus]
MAETAERIDAHQHFWRLERGDYGWLTPEFGPIYRDFGPDDLAPLLKQHGIAGTVLVQAAPTDAETDYLLGIADGNDMVRGVVGWVDFEAEDAVERLRDLARHPKFVGVRPMIQDIPAEDWMLNPAFAPVFEAIAELGLVFDALVLPRHLTHLDTLIKRHPQMTVVIDHGAKPEIATGRLDVWATDMVRLAAHENCHCKLSGFVTEAGEDWNVEQLAPYVAHILSVFGPERVIWGSDWPVMTLAAAYEDWVTATDVLIAGLHAAERAAVLGGNARRVYKLENGGRHD